MKALFWLAVIAAAAVLAFLVRYLLGKHTERERAAEARAAEFLAQAAGARPPAAAPAKAPAIPGALETQKLLFDAARRAGDAGEPALAVQLYERLLARFPDSAFAGEVRAAAEAQKKLIGT